MGHGFLLMPKIQVDSRIQHGALANVQKNAAFRPSQARRSVRLDSPWSHFGGCPLPKNWAILWLSSGYPPKLYIYIHIYIYIIYNYNLYSCPCHLLYLLAVGWLSGLKTVVPELSVSNSMASRPGASLETVCIPRLRSSMDNPQPKPAIGLLANAPSETMGNYGKLWETSKFPSSDVSTWLQQSEEMIPERESATPSLLASLTDGFG